MLKADLRKIYLGKQKSLSPIEREQKSAQIADLFFSKFDLNPIRFLHGFLPIKKFNEIDATMIFQTIWREFPHIETLIPRINFEISEIENLKFTSEIELVENQWQIQEPKHDELVETEKIDAVLVPLLCFDMQGFRVGYGKGFYDRLLKNCRKDCLKIGLSFFPQVENIEDTKEFDVRLDYFITPDEILKQA